MDSDEVLVKGNCEKIGEPKGIITHVVIDRVGAKRKKVKEQNFENHEDALRVVLALLEDENFGSIKHTNEISAIGHRVVQDRNIFGASVLLNEKVIKEIEHLSELSPLHNKESAAIIKACMNVFEGIPEIAVFDSEFHKTIPDYAYMYGLPYKYYEKYGIRKYGFHGISYKYIAQKCSKVIGKDLEELKIICCHLGSGCSVVAISGGGSVDTSMGFTPLDGLFMATRCGEVDVSAVLYLMKQEKFSVDQMIDILNKESGYFGVSEISGDSRLVVEAAARENALAKLLLKMQSYKIKKYIGAYAAAMNGFEVLIFTGGIGENSVQTRELVCADMDFFSLRLDKELNSFKTDGCRRISAENSKDIWIIPAGEEKMIAQEVKEVLIKEGLL